MKKSLPIGTFFILLAFLESVAQVVPSAPSSSSVLRSVSVHSTLDYFNNPRDLEEIDGTPYSNENFVDGEIATVDQTFGAIPLRYNIYADQIEFKENDSVFTISPDPFFTKISIGDANFIVDVLGSNKKSIHSFFEILEDGELKLLKKMSVNLRERKEPSPMQSNGMPAKYFRGTDTYYYKSGNIAPVKIPNLKKIVADLPHHRNEMEAFIKRNRLNNNESDLVEFFKYYNSLD